MLVCMFVFGRLLATQNQQSFCSVAVLASLVIIWLHLNELGTHFSCSNVSGMPSRACSPAHTQTTSSQCSQINGWSACTYRLLHVDGSHHPKKKHFYLIKIYLATLSMHDTGTVCWCMGLCQIQFYSSIFRVVENRKTGKFGKPVVFHIFS